MPGGRQHDRQVEELRRALYRPGSGGADLRSYLDASHADSPVEPQPARAPRTPREWRMPHVEPPTGIAPKLGIGALLLAVLLAVPAAAGDPPEFRLPSASSGGYSTPFPVPASAAIVGSAMSGQRTLWGGLTGTSTFPTGGGIDVASASGDGHLFSTVAQAEITAAGTRPLTIFVACTAGSVQVGFGAVAEDFDMGYQFELTSVTVPCAGVQCVRYNRPAGIVPYAVSARGSGRVAVSVVAGL